jgi:hypothetical protein
MDECIELLVTAVVTAEDETEARAACAELVRRSGGRIAEVGDCAAEEPGCWAVTVRVPTPERATYQVAAPLARAVRRFVRELTPQAATPRVACEPPTAWTVLDDPAQLGELTPGAERLLVEAWCGGDPLRLDSPAPLAEADLDAELDEDADDDIDDLFDADLDSDAEPAWPIEPGIDPDPEPDQPDELTGADDVADVTDRRPATPSRLARPTEEAPHREPDLPTGPWQAPVSDSGADYRLSLRVDVATVREAGAEWQARAVASRISRSITLTGMTAHDGVLSVQIDLGPTLTPPSQTVLTAVSALDRRGWSPLSWEGEVASTRWTAQPRPDTGITELELSSGPDRGRRR